MDAEPDADDGGLPAANKAGAERAVRETFGERALIARAGLILGPGEDIGRLPWWLTRIARGGDVLAPGPATCRCSTSTSGTWRAGCWTWRRRAWAGRSTR